MVNASLYGTPVGDAGMIESMTLMSTTADPTYSAPGHAIAADVGDGLDALSEFA